jgi:hypothetical protein
LLNKILLSVLAISLVGCAQHVTVRPPVTTSLGYRVFKALGEINRYPVQVGVLIDPKLEAETIRVNTELGTAEIPFGQIVSAKIFQVLSYKFERITFVTESSKSPPLLFAVALESESPAVAVDIDQHPVGPSGAATFDVLGAVDVRIRIMFTENGKQIWIGHARVVGETTSGGAAYGVIEGNNQAPDIANRVTDELIADFVQQLQCSEELKRLFEGKRFCPF